MMPKEPAIASSLLIQIISAYPLHIHSRIQGQQILRRRGHNQTIMQIVFETLRLHCADHSWGLRRALQVLT